MNREKLEEKIEKIKERIKLSENSCVALAREEYESLESDRMYLKILEEKLRKME